MSDLIKISGCENPHRIGDVIFVHGLWGDAIETWHPQRKRDRDAKDFWPAWLGEDLPNVGIWSLDYEAEPSKWIGTTMPLFDRAKNALEMLDSYEIGDHPVIFIAHSMGGLLVKQMLRNSLQYNQPSWKKILSQTRGIVFLATPHTGADLASWIVNLGGIFRPTESVAQLKANAPELRELNEFYINTETLRSIPMKVYYEKQKTKGVLVATVQKTPLRLKVLLRQGFKVS